MRLHPTRTNLAPSALGRQPSTCALDSSRSLPFIAPLRPRWSPVVFERKMPSISFPILLLRDSVPHNEGGIPLPHRSLGASATSGTSFNSLNFFALIFLRTLLRCDFLQPLSFQLLPHSFAKTTGGTYPRPGKRLLGNEHRGRTKGLSFLQDFRGRGRLRAGASGHVDGNLAEKCVGRVRNPVSSSGDARAGEGSGDDRPARAARAALGESAEARGVWEKPGRWSKPRRLYGGRSCRSGLCDGINAGSWA